jgi:hypothetical protein
MDGNSGLRNSGTPDGSMKELVAPDPAAAGESDENDAERPSISGPSFGELEAGEGSAISFGEPDAGEGSGEGSCTPLPLPPPLPPCLGVPPYLGDGEADAEAECGNGTAAAAAASIGDSMGDDK